MKMYRIFIIDWSRNLRKTERDYVSIVIIRKWVSLNKFLATLNKIPSSHLSSVT